MDDGRHTGAPGPGAGVGIVLLLSASVLWGTTGAAQQLAAVGADPAAVGAARLGLGALALTLAAMATGHGGALRAAVSGG